MSIHPKNHFKFCPRCASKVEFNSTEYSFKCSDCDFYYFLNSSAAVAALIFNEKGELLLARRGVEPEYGKLDLPGGFIDPGESAETALMREMEEELDIIPETIEYYVSYPNEYHFAGTIVFTTDLFFKCYVKDLSQLKCRDDIIGLEFIHLSKINFDEIPFASIKNVIKKIKNE